MCKKDIPNHDSQPESSISENIRSQIQEDQWRNLQPTWDTYGPRIVKVIHPDYRLEDAASLFLQNHENQDRQTIEAFQKTRLDLFEKNIWKDVYPSGMELRVHGTGAPESAGYALWASDIEDKTPCRFARIYKKPGISGPPNYTSPEKGLTNHNSPGIFCVQLQDEAQNEKIFDPSRQQLRSSFIARRSKQLAKDNLDAAKNDLDLGISSP